MVKSLLKSVLFCAFLIISFVSSATTVTALGGNWNVGGTWDTGSVPNCSDIIVIPAGVTVHLIGHVNFTASGCIPTIIVSGRLTFSNGKKLRLGAGGCVQIQLGGQIVPSSNGGGASEIVEINNQDWWQASDGTLTGTVASEINLGCGVMLPVELVSYEIAYTNDVAEISFTTASERDLDYFIIEVSRDGSYWQELEKISATGNTTTESNYKVYDKSPFNGVSYYRLKEVDINGLVLELEVIVGNYNGVKYLLYPVPVNKSMFLEGSYLAESDIKVINSVGDVVNVGMNFFGDKLSFDFSEVKNGIYYLVIENAFTTKTERISVVHK